LQTTAVTCIAGKKCYTPYSLTAQTLLARDIY